MITVGFYKNNTPGKKAELDATGKIDFYEGNTIKKKGKGGGIDFTK